MGGGISLSSDNFDFDLNSILSEFTDSTDFSPETPSKADSSRISAEEDLMSGVFTEEHPVPGRPSAPQAKWHNPFSEETAVFTPVKDAVQEDKITHFADKYKKQEAEKKEKKSVSMPKLPDFSALSAKKEPLKDTEETSLYDLNPAPAKREKNPRPVREKKPPKEKAPKQPKAPKPPKIKKERPPRLTFADVAPRWLVSVVGLILTLVLLLFVLMIAPASGSAAAVKTVPKTADIASAVNRFATEKAKEAAIAASAYAEELAAQQAVLTKKVYKIPEDALIAPEPLSLSFGKVSTANASEIMDVIQKARDCGLLEEDETVVFDPNVEFNTGSYYQDIQYYLDDTLLVICWKEIIDGNTCTFCEVKMQDGSQFRRKLAGDMFGSDVLEYTTSMHEATNAVVSMNADYYRFRDMGIVAYDRQLFRFNENIYVERYGQMLKKYNCIDSLFVTSSGDFLFYHMFDQTTPEEMEQFIADNDIVFSIAFGPILVENGELNESYFDEEWYPIGEINTGYSRAGIGQLGKLHYLYMSLNHSDEKQARWHTKEFAQHFFDKGVVNAYSLDGGQTSEIVFQGNEAYNHVDHVNGTSSRQVSDMIYFASAINGEEVTE